MKFELFAQNFTSFALRKVTIPKRFYEIFSVFYLRDCLVDKYFLWPKSKRPFYDWILQTIAQFASTEKAHETRTMPTGCIILPWQVVKGGEEEIISTNKTPFRPSFPGLQIWGHPKGASSGKYLCHWVWGYFLCLLGLAKYCNQSLYLHLQPQS